MNPRELRSAVVRDQDPYLQAHREMQEQLTARRRDWAGLDFDEREADEISWRACDTHLSALLARQGKAQAIAHDLGLDTPGEHPEVIRWRANRARAQREVKMLEKLGEPVPDDLRAEAEEPDQGPAVAQAVEAMRQRSKHAWARVKSGQL